MTEGLRAWRQLAAAPSSLPGGDGEGSAPVPAVANKRELSVSAPSRLPRAQKILPATADARDGTGGDFALNELGHAERLLHEHGRDIRYVPEVEAWLVWDRDHWIWDRDGARARRLVANLHARVYEEGACNLSEAQHYLAWARKSQTCKIIRNVLALASDFDAVRISVDDVDASPMLVGIDGARSVIDLANGSVRSARREDFVTRSLAPARVGNADAPERWLKFLDEVFLGDQELIDWLHRFFGYCLTGATSEHIFLFAFGHGANGKSVLLSVLADIWGEYARTIQPDVLMQQMKSGGGPTPDVARLAGARLVMGSETESGKELAESLVKQLTGGDRVSARNLYSSTFEFTPNLKLLLAGNHRPNIQGTDTGIWRRVRQVPFTRTFTRAERDPQLTDKLLAEAEHILAWMIEGCRRWLREGLGDTPAAVRAATEEYRGEQDVLGQWRIEKTIPSGSAHASNLYKSYRAWAEACGLRSMSMQAFGRQLGELGLKKRHTSKGAVYEGICLD